MRALALALLCLGAPAAAQPTAEALPPNTEPLDVAVLRGVYGVDAPLATGLLSAVNDTAYPVFLAAAPLVGAAALATGGDLDPALRLGLAEAGATALTLALKNAVRRPRPYAAVAGIAARDPEHAGDDVFDPHAFPSGHTAIAFALATSASLSAPEWYVVGPAAAWAVTMGAARVWMGVHYPSDVAVGALVGAGSAVAVHLLMPDVFGGDEAAAAPVRIVVPL